MKTKTHLISGTMVSAIEMVTCDKCPTSGPMPLAISPARRPLIALSRRIMRRIGALIVFAGLIAAAKGQPVVPPVVHHPCDCIEASTACSCDCRIPRRPRQIAQDDVVGTWFISLSHATGKSQTLVTFHSDGTLTSASADFGVWDGSNGEYTATTDAFTFDDHGFVTGRRRTGWSIVVTPLDELQANFVVDLIA